MALILMQAPADLPVSLEEAKQHIRVDFDDDDAMITDFISAATAKLDGRDGLLGRALMTQQWRLTLDCFPREIVVPLPPLQSIVSVTYIDPDGATQSLAPGAYDIVGLGGTDPVRLVPAYGTSWPATRGHPEAVAVTFLAGYGEDGSPPTPAVPEPLRTAIKMHVGHLYENRENVMALSGFVGPTPHGYDSLIADYRVWSW